jgi:DNA-binding Lrp family transcriptional regulator
MYEPFDETAVRVLLAVNPGDSIRTVAQHLHTPYETVRQAVNQLEDAGYLRYDDGLFVTDDRVRKAARDLLATSAAVNPPSIEEAYVLPQFGDWPFAFTKVDAVYVWTQGGYQVGREPDDYPLFLAVREKDVDAWQRFFEQFGIPTGFERRPEDSFEGPLQVVLNERSVLNPDHVEGYPVISRRETIEFMRKHYATFQSALAMLDRMYDDLDLDVSYRESERECS